MKSHIYFTHEIDVALHHHLFTIYTLTHTSLPNQS